MVNAPNADFLEETIDVAGTPACHLTSPGTRPPLLFVHGVSGNHRMWPVLFEHLPGRAKVAPSLPGRCGTEGPVIRDAEEGAAWVARYLEAIEAVSVIAVGHSFGGAVVLELALAHPERVSGMVLVSSGARLRVHPMILEVVQESVALGQRLLPGRAAWTDAASEAVRERVEAARMQTSIETELDDWRACDRFDRMGGLAAIRCPAHVLVGERDPTTPPKYAQHLAQSLPNASLQIVPNVGHMLPFERADLVAEEIERFARRLGH